MSEDRKAKIRERYKGNSAADIKVIPALEQPSFYEDFSEKRVAVYARVSTGSANQTSSYELQKGYYEQDVTRHPGWKLVRIYADEGISGTSLSHRDEFVQMIKDCEAGKIDLIITKSVSRFSRNVLDCIGEVRKLASLPHPVGVFFETENIYTLNSDSEMSLSFVSTLAQEESHTKSRSMDRSVDMRFSMGIFLTPALLGYDLDEDGRLIINEDEALTVRLCFFMYLYGYSCQQIAETLMKLGRLTKLGNTKWTAGTVLAVLQNERHCGDILARKTWTPSYLNHKSKKNRNEPRKYYSRDDHPAIISRDDFIATQRLIANSKYGHKGLLPSLHVITAGILRGFIEINPHWAGFTKEDYFNAVSELEEQSSATPVANIQDIATAFDLSGFEIARANFFQTPEDISVSLSAANLLFSRACVLKMGKADVIELLFDPIRKLLAVRTAPEDSKHGIQWASTLDGRRHVKMICGSAFMPLVYEILGWDKETRYKVRGLRRQKDQQSVLFFDLNDAEKYIDTIPNDPDNGSSRRCALFEDGMKPMAKTYKTKVVASPASWVESFGRKATGGSVPLTQGDNEPWRVSEAGIPYQVDKDLNPSTEAVLQQGSQDIVSTIQRRE